MGVTEKLGGSPGENDEVSPYAEIFEYKVLQGILAELSSFGVVSEVVKVSEIIAVLDWWEDNPIRNRKSHQQGRFYMPKFVLDVPKIPGMSNVRIRMWVDGVLRVQFRFAGEDNARVRDFDLSHPNSIASLLEFLGVGV